MTFDEYYGKIFEKTIKNDQTISQYEQELNERCSYVSNLMISTSIVDKIAHPFRLVRTIAERNRISKIKSAYDSLKGSYLVEHFDEESGDLNTDFYAAASSFKPRRIREFIEYNPLRLVDKGKLLQKKL